MLSADLRSDQTLRANEICPVQNIISHRHIGRPKIDLYTALDIFNALLSILKTVHVYWRGSARIKCKSFQCIEIAKWLNTSNNITAISRVYLWGLILIFETNFRGKEGKEHVVGHLQLQHQKFVESPSNIPVKIKICEPGPESSVRPAKK